jgi:hypothetical protein
VIGKRYLRIGCRPRDARRRQGGGAEKLPRVDRPVSEHQIVGRSLRGRVRPIRALNSGVVKVKGHVRTRSEGVDSDVLPAEPPRSVKQAIRPVLCHLERQKPGDVRRGFAGADRQKRPTTEDFYVAAVRARTIQRSLHNALRLTPDFPHRAVTDASLSLNCTATA